MCIRDRITIYKDTLVEASDFLLSLSPVFVLVPLAFIMAANLYYGNFVSIFVTLGDSIVGGLLVRQFHS